MKPSTGSIRIARDRSIFRCSSIGVQLPYLQKVITHFGKEQEQALLCMLIIKQLLIDAGPHFRQQALLNQINHIDALLVTHVHYDHVGGIDI